MSNIAIKLNSIVSSGNRLYKVVFAQDSDTMSSILTGLGISGITDSLSETCQITRLASTLSIYSSAIAYNLSLNGLLLFGGRNRYSGVLQDKTYFWNNGTWEELTTGVTPPARAGACMIYDPISEKTLMYGGGGAGGPLTDTWIFDHDYLTDWEQLHPEHNPGVTVGDIGFDGSNIIFTGSTGTWKWNGSDWIFITNEGPYHDFPLDIWHMIPSP